MISLLGLAGQAGYNMISAVQESEPTPRRSIMQRLIESRWVPLKALSDQQYEEMLQQKLLKLDVEVSMIDEKIAALKVSKKDMSRDGSTEGISTT